MIEKIWKRIKNGFFAIIFIPAVIITLIAYVVLYLAFLMIAIMGWLIRK